MNSQHTIVGLGEVLWDLLPSGRQLGGAPANFAYCAHLLGNHGVVVSRAGSDTLGSELRDRLGESGISDEYIQNDPVLPTGTVNVNVDFAGQPEFEITYPAAWDFLEWNGELEQLARSCDVVCLGTLAQRSEQSRSTILKFLQGTRNECLRVFDVNLRQSFYSAEIILQSLEKATAVKLNEHELPIVANLLGIAVNEFCQSILTRFQLQFVCVTRGEKGSVLLGRDGMHEHSGFQIKVKDTVGAGDAFTAGLVHEYLRGSSLAQMNDTANRMGAWVASQAGGMPRVEKGKPEIQQLPGSSAL